MVSIDNNSNDENYNDENNYENNNFNNNNNNSIVTGKRKKITGKFYKQFYFEVDTLIIGGTENIMENVVEISNTHASRVSNTTGSNVSSDSSDSDYESQQEDQIDDEEGHSSMDLEVYSTPPQIDLLDQEVYLVDVNELALQEHYDMIQKRQRTHHHYNHSQDDQDLP